MNKSNSPENLAQHQRAVVVAPAGCGKTELIVQSVGCCTDKQLVLTHTHAGVDSLKSRFRKYNIPSSLFHVETIHSFALRYTSSYPKTSGLLTSTPKTGDDYDNVIQSAICLFDLSLTKQILQNTYAGAYVDEYQDCTIQQHQLIMKLADLLPCRVVGDPLQGIFNFGNNQIVDWERDVFPHFERIDDLTEPWRWKKSNPKLGDWLLGEVRYKLLQGESIDISWDLESLGCFCEDYSDINATSIMTSVLKDDYTTYTITVPHIPMKCHLLAGKLQNRYKTIEPITSKEICDFATSIDNKEGIDRIEGVIEFADGCLTHVGQDCNSIIHAMKAGGHKFQLERKISLYTLATQVASSHDYKTVLDFYNYLIATYNPTIKRHQLWMEMNKALVEVIGGNHKSLAEAVWEIRSRSKYIGRRVPKRCISRTLLLKGLECDCAIVVDAGLFDIKNLYVAMTRPSKRLYILLNHPSTHFNDQRPQCPNCNVTLVKRNGARGDFFGCPNYPKCKFTRAI